MSVILADRISKGMIAESILRFFHGKNVVVTGGSGLIGRQIVSRLIEAGASVRSVSLDEIQVEDNVEYLKGDLCDFGFCQRIVRDMDCVFHVAGIKGSIEVTKSKPASFLVPLLMMNTNMLEACRLNKVERECIPLQSELTPVRKYLKNMRVRTKVHPWTCSPDGLSAWLSYKFKPTKYSTT